MISQLISCNAYYSSNHLHRALTEHPFTKEEHSQPCRTSFRSWQNKFTTILLHTPQHDRRQFICPPGSRKYIAIWSTRFRSSRHSEPQRREKKISGKESGKAENERFGKSGLIKKRVVKESRTGRIRTRLEEPGAEAKGGTKGEKGGTIVSNNKDRDTSNTYIIISTITPTSIRVDAPF